MDIVWLGDEICHERALVGGKAAHLSRLAANYKVPPGFCLTAGWDYAAFATPGSPRFGRLAEAYDQLADRTGVPMPGVAVRSSAVDEDGSGNSFAGLHDTVLNVSGPEAVAAAVMQCWESVKSERALVYRERMGLKVDEVQLAVLVQQLVPSDVSAVAFSANPVTGDRSEIVVEANWGLGESIVSGTTAPDTFILAKADGRLRQQVLGAKERMTVPVASGTEEVQTPRSKRTQPSLSKAQLVEVASLVRALEADMGWPVDVECAFHDEVLYLLQCRAITNLG